MKFVETDNLGRETGSKIIYWAEHQFGCSQCRPVNIDLSATFVDACALGSKLIMEELAKRAAPVQAENKKKIAEEAQKTGVFVMGKSNPDYVKSITKYK